MSLFAVTLMPLVVLVLGIVVSLVVVGGFADANQQAKQMPSNRLDKESPQTEAAPQGEKIIVFDGSRRAG